MIIAFHNSKGGVGTTTLVTHTCALARDCGIDVVGVSIDVKQELPRWLERAQIGCIELDLQHGHTDADLIVLDVQSHSAPPLNPDVWIVPICDGPSNRIAGEVSDRLRGHLIWLGNKGHTPIVPAFLADDVELATPMPYSRALAQAAARHDVLWNVPALANSVLQRTSATLTPSLVPRSGDSLIALAAEHVYVVQTEMGDAFGEYDAEVETIRARIAAGDRPSSIANDLHALEPRGVVDQQPLAFGQDRVVGGVPGDGQGLGDSGDGQVLDNQRGERPPQRRPGQPGPRLRSLGRVLPPYAPAASAPVPADGDRQRRRTPPERLVRQLPDHTVARSTLAAAASAPSVVVDDAAGQHRPVGLQALPGHDQAELVKARERGQVGASEGSVGHVEVFRMGSVRTSILGRPRPLPRHRRADQAYTLICAEPVWPSGNKPIKGGWSG